MINELKNLIDEKFTTKALDAKEFQKLKIGPMRYKIEHYEIENVGNLILMYGTAMLGLMKMETLIFTPLKKDAPLASYDLIQAMGNEKLFFEFYNTQVEQEFDSEAFKKSIPDNSLQLNFLNHENWYDFMKYSCSIYKAGKRKDHSKISEISLDAFTKYLDFVKDSTDCDEALKKEKTKTYVDGLISNGGVSTEAFIKAIGEEKVREFYYHIAFGIKCDIK